MKADLATIGPEATLKARRCVGPTRKVEVGDLTLCSPGYRSMRTGGETASLISRHYTTESGVE